MTTVLTKIELLTKLVEENGWELWLGRDLQPAGYDHSSLVRVTAFGSDVAGHAQVRPILDYEAAVAVQLKHRGVVPTVRAGLDDKYWFAEELIVGESVGDVVHQLRERGYPTLTVPLTLAIGVQVCEALQSAHGAKNAAGWSLNAVHGGIDLDVVLLTYDGVVRVREFGVAKARRQAWLSRVGGLAPRRICHISPEEVRGRAADPRSDVYGVGAVLYELLTGAPPVSGADPLKAIADGVSHPPSSHNPKVTPQLDTIVMRALSLDPADRYENCDHLRHDLLRLANDPSQALERVPRILSQLFPGKQAQWAEIQQFERKREWVMVQGFLEKLLIPTQDDDPTGLHVMPVHAHEPSPFEDDIESALDALSAPQGTGWESSQVGDAAAKLSGMWDDTAGSARKPLPEDMHSTIQAGSAPRINGEQDISQTLPTGVPAQMAPVAVPVLDVAETHMAYKPTPMPEPAPPPVQEPVYPEPVYQDPAPAPARAPEPVTSTPQPAPVPSAQAVPEVFEIPAEEDDDDDEPFVEPFAIAELVAAPELQPREASTKAVLEIIRTAHGRALDIQVLDSPFSGYRQQGGAVKARLVGGKASLKLKQPMGGWIRRGRNPREDLPADTKFSLAAGDAAEFRDGDVLYHVRCFNPPIPPKSERQIITAEDLKIYAVAIAVSLVLHGVGGLATLLTSYLGVELTVKAPEQVEVFAEGALPKDEPKVEKPKPKVEKPKPKRIEPKPTTDPSEAQAKIPKAVRQQLDKRLKNNNVPRSEDKADQLISALTTPVKGDGATIKDVVTNIDAVARPGSRGAAFNVTGTLGNLPEGGVNIATSAGGNRIGDIGGSVATDVGKLDKREGSGTGKVRGKARGVKALAKVSGSLSKGEVWEVIQKHSGQIQACYERQLGKNPGLAGKLTFEWVVKTNGSVGTVKEANNTLGDAAVSKCVSGVIKTMKFPRPKGGEVEIVFPWIFKAG